jgi:uncharacterized protein (DUF58 family)
MDDGSTTDLPSKARLLPSTFRYPLSREGTLWFVMACAMLVTGLFKGINLITLLACWMVTVVFLNYWWARPQLRPIVARRLFPEPAFAGTPFCHLLHIQNNSGRTVMGIAVHDASEGGAGAAPRARRFLAEIAAHSTATLSVTWDMPRRGLFPMEPLRLTTGYPLALVHLTKLMAARDRLVVFPRLGTLHRTRLRRFLAQHSSTVGQARAYPRRHPGAQTEFHGLRPFRAGDSPRWIHWRTTARRGEFMVREFEDMPNDHLVLIVDPGLSEGPMLERLLSLAATICWEWCRQRGERLALGIASAEPWVYVGNTGHDCACVMLEQLALTNACPSGSAARFLDSLRDADLPPGPILVLSPSDSDLTPAIAQSLHRSVAHLDLGRGEDEDFFEMKDA